jgi:hypothetical protein
MRYLVGAGLLLAASLVAYVGLPYKPPEILGLGLNQFIAVCTWTVAAIIVAGAAVRLVAGRSA